MDDVRNTFLHNVFAHIQKAQLSPALSIGHHGCRHALQTRSQIAHLDAARYARGLHLRQPHPRKPTCHDTSGSCKARVSSIEETHIGAAINNIT